MTQKNRAGESVRQRAWTAIRVFKVFTAAQIQATAEVGRANLHKYLKALTRSGYLAQRRPNRNGPAVWRLVRDSGPTAPIVRRGGTGVYDPNRDVAHPFLDAGHD